MNLSRIYGLHAVRAALDYSPEKITGVWVDASRRDIKLTSILEDLSRLKLPVKNVDRKQLDRLTEGKNHQGIVLEVQMPRTRSDEELKRDFINIEGLPLFLILDHIQDPHNLGACLRTADSAGVNGIVITKDQSVGFSPTVVKVASGAAETVPVYQVTNLARILRWLKDHGVWVMGAAGEAKQSLFQTDFKVPMALVIGAEGKGMRRLIKEQCDILVHIPMNGKVESLNLSVATGILLYEAVRQRDL